MAKLEFKYLVRNELRAAIRREMIPYLALDPYADRMPDKQYTVRSIYYDTRWFEGYYDKLEGLCEKKKFRIRGYNAHHDDAAVFLEIKKKSGIISDKARAQFKWHQVKSIFSLGGAGVQHIAGGKNDEEKANARQFLAHYHGKKLLPTVLVTYEREAYCGRFDPLFRVTLDLNVRSIIYPSLGMLYEERGMGYALPHHFVLEFKFYRGLPRWAHSIISRYGLSRLAISKYLICLDAPRMIGKFGRSFAYMSAGGNP